MVARTVLLGASIATALASSGCARELPPLPSVVLSVDTDLSVPRTVTRLRIDVFAEDGTWLYSRDVPRIRPEEWPASFGIASPDESKSTTVLVRLRAYAEGATRDYRGESYEARPDYAPPHVAGSIDELCAGAQDLPPFEARTFRRGKEKLTTCTCAGTADGSAAASVRITKHDSYRFEVIDSVPTLDINGGTDTTLSLRRSCAQISSELGCNDDIDANNGNYLSRLVLDLDPGTYYVVTGGGDEQPADITLRWAPASQWGPDNPPRAVPPPVARSVPAQPNPRLLDATGDVTPTTEPLPAVAVDRLVRVKLEPGVAGTVAVKLAGACAGTMAQLDVGSITQIVTETARTCVDDPSSLVAPAVLTAGGAAPATSAVGTFLADPCAPDESDDQVVCVPGGDTVLGGPELDGYDLSGTVATLPMRAVGLHKFWIDRYEFTVGRYRQSVKAGFAYTHANPPIANDAAMPPTDDGSLKPVSTYSTSPIGRESFPLNTVVWDYARAACEYWDGALPTEAQWEYAAGSAGRTARAAYPWGEDPATCARGVINRVIPSATRCTGPVLEAVDSPAALNDSNALGIIGLGGSVGEWTLDAAARYDAPCWQAAGATDPLCVDPSAPLHVYRGGSFRSPLFLARPIIREEWGSNSRTALFGFRCAYAQAPGRRWSGR